MNWQDLILSVVSIVLTSLVSWAMVELKKWLSKKAKTEKQEELMTNALDIVESAVKVVYQTYVEELKGKDMFTKEAQVEALSKAKTIAEEQCSQAVKDYINLTFGDFGRWVNIAIEAAIYSLKN